MGVYGDTLESRTLVGVGAQGLLKFYLRGAFYLVARDSNG